MSILFSVRGLLPGVVGCLLAAVVLVGCGSATTESADLKRSFGTPDADEICALSESACDAGSGGGDAESEIAATVRRLQRAFLEGDARSMCPLVTEAAHYKAGMFGHGRPTTCERNLKHALRMIGAGGGWLSVPNPRVTDVEVDGTHATARVQVGRDRPAELAFTEEAGRWKLDALFGASISQVRERVATAASSRLRSPEGKPVEAVDRRGAPCKPITRVRDQRLDGSGQRQIVFGGCRTRAYSGHLAVSIATAFGDFKFGDCTLNVELVTDGSGRGWAETPLFSNGLKSPGCADIFPCERDARLRVASDKWLAPPWRTRLTSDGKGGLIYTMSACLNTCVGYFVGDVALNVRKGERGWRIEADEADFGASGVRVDGTFEIDETDLDLSATAN